MVAVDASFCQITVWNKNPLSTTMFIWKSWTACMVGLNRLYRADFFVFHNPISMKSVKGMAPVHTQRTPSNPLLNDCLLINIRWNSNVGPTKTFSSWIFIDRGQGEYPIFARQLNVWQFQVHYLSHWLFTNLNSIAASYCGIYDHSTWKRHYFSSLWEGRMYKLKNCWITESF